MTYGNDHTGAAAAGSDIDSDMLNYRDPLSTTHFPDDPGYADEPHRRSQDVGQFLSDNRLPLALVGAGIGWLLLSAARKTDAYDRAAHWAEERTRTARQNLRRRYNDLTHRVEEGLHRAEHRMEETGEELSHRADSLRREARRRLNRMRPSRQVQELSDRYAAYGESAYGYHPEDSEGGRRYRRIVEETEAMARRARRRAVRINRSFWDLVDEHPVSAGLVGLAVGAAIGASLPATRTEDEWVGRYRDDLLEEALRKGRRTAEKASTVAKEAAKAGADAAARTADTEAEKQGLKAEL